MNFHVFPSVHNLILSLSFVEINSSPPENVENEISRTLRAFIEKSRCFTIFFEFTISKKGKTARKPTKDRVPP